METRIRRWMKITGLRREHIAEMAAESVNLYRDGCGKCSSGFTVGEWFSVHLGAGSSDRRIRAWGDFLIDYGYTLV